MERELRQAVLDVAARAAALRETAAEEVAARRAEAAGERRVSGRTEGLLSAFPLAAREDPKRVGRWLEGTRDRFAGRVLLDAEGRPLLHERVDDGYLLSLWRYDADRTEEVRFRGGQQEVTWVLHPGGGPPIGAVGAEPGRRAERWTWRRGQVVRVDQARAAPRGWASAVAVEADLDADGAVARLRRGHDDTDFGEHNRLAEDAWLDALAGALERAAGLACDQVTWIAARDAPARLRADTGGMADWLAGALAGAIAEAAGDSGIDEPFCVHVGAGGDDDWLHVLLADERWRRGITAGSPHDGEAIRGLWRGVEHGLVAELDVTGRLGDAALRGCAELRDALGLYGDPRDRARAEPVLLELADRLAARLGEPRRFPGATPDFLPLVQVDHEEGDAPLERAERTLGRDRRERFTAAVRSRAPAGADSDVARRARTDRAALAQVLAAHGLRAHAERLAHEVAEVGHLLRSGGGGSRLGGPPLLPPGAGWPAGTFDRPLSFLAAIDLRELPDAPAAGWWLFFADLGEDESGWGFYEPERNVPGSRARLLHVPPGEEPVEARSPAQALRHRRVRFEPVLTLPSFVGAGAALGLDPFEAEAYEAAQDALWEALGEPSWMGGQHWVGGHVPDAQGDEPEEDSVLMLHLADDASLGFSFLDAGTIQFRIPAAALARGDYAAVVGEPSSC